MKTDQNTFERNDSLEQYAKSEYIVIFISESARLSTAKIKNERRNLVFHLIFTTFAA